MSDSKIISIVSNGLVAAIYFVLTVVNPFSFGLFQLRFAEILCFLCFFRKDFIFGVTIGCVLSNINSTLGLWDVLIGGSATLISCLLIAYLSPRLWLSALFVIVVNSLIIGIEIFYFLDVQLWLSILSIFVSETICMIIGYICFKLLRNNESFFKSINANQHLDWKW